MHMDECVSLVTGNDSVELCWGLYVLPEKLGVSAPANCRSQVVMSGRWLWVYDNVNLHQKVRHEREGNRA